jgi:hypothetical protein
MGLQNQDFTTWKGNYRVLQFYIQDVSTVTGGTAKWVMSSDTGTTGSQLIVKTSVASTGITLSGKYVNVTLEPYDTSSVDPGEYYHELRLVDVVGQPSTPAIGTVTLLDVIITS